MKKLPLYIVVFMLLLPAFGMQWGSHDHHESADSLHHLAHEMGHAHSHDESDHNNISFEFSKEAVEHISDPLDRLAMEFVAFKATKLNRLKLAYVPDLTSSEPQEPYLSYSGPPPRV